MSPGSLCVLLPLAMSALSAVCFPAAGGEPPNLLPAVEAERRVLAGKLQAQVEGDLTDAKRLMSQDPAQAERNLKLTLEVLESLPAIDAELRGGLRREVSAAMREARGKMM